jgi:O-antigen/teichoic acid export membrane protein
MVASSSVLALAIYLALPLVKMVLLNDEFEDAASILPWLLLIIPVIATTNAPMNGLLGLGRADIRMRVYLMAAAVAIASYVILIPAHSWRGAVVGTVISEVFLSICAWSSLWRHQRRADQVINRRRLLPAT